MYRTKWIEYKGFIIGWDSQYTAYGVWDKEPDWYDYNCLGVYCKTIEEAKKEADNFYNRRAFFEIEGYNLV